MWSGLLTSQGVFGVNFVTTRTLCLHSWWLAKKINHSSSAKVTENQTDGDTITVSFHTENHTMISILNQWVAIKKINRNLCLRKSESGWLFLPVWLHFTLVSLLTEVMLNIYCLFPRLFRFFSSHGQMHAQKYLRYKYSDTEHPEASMGIIPQNRHLPIELGTFTSVHSFFRNE